MKCLRKSTLAVVIAAVPMLAQAELKVLDDSTLGAVTGQAGITIELETKIDIGEVKYTDEGSLSIQNVSLGGANKTSFLGINSWGVTASDTLDNIKIDIDIAADGDAIINLGPVEFGVIDFQLSMDKVELQGATDSTTVMSNFNLVGLMGAGSLIVDTADDSLNVVVSVAIDDLDFDLDFMAVGIRDVQVTGTTFNPSAPQALRAFFDVDFKVYSTANTRTASGQALAIDLNSLAMDVSVGAIEIGGTSIGSLYLDDLVISNTHMEIYGH